MRISMTFVLVAATAAAACGKKNEAPAAGSGTASASAAPAEPAPPPSAAPTPAPTPPPAPAAATLTDPQIAAIVVAANQVDIDAGQLALKKSKNAEVKEFAQRMITDHGGVNKAAVALVTKLNVKPEETDASRGLTSGGEANRTKLGALDGAAFDTAYVDNEVAYHQAVLDVIDKQLIPSAQNAELKGMLTSVRPAIAAHLEHAQHLQATLAGGGSGSGSGSAMDHGAHGSK